MPIKKNVYVAGKIQINEIKKQIENLTSRVIDSSKNIFISYYYKDDLCSTSIDNKWARTEIKEMKRYYKPQIKKIKHTGTIFICLFEQGIFLKNKPKSKYEYFYTDTNNFFRNNIFKSPTLCGSYALFKPNGEVLIFNGESRPDFMIKNLKSKKWNTFFKYYYKQNPTP
ncbi:hypothetical protein CLV33_101113 [Jejuia pallidilutea]|uniref:Uncharacterized protein n=1 Tax=Jejuia pallidilutea TaxID=504487 RepID=A0A362XFX2_9FLAO|nr:hypothetical protein CLV33_101113 [Jejuia pallidilutea]